MHRTDLESLKNGDRVTLFPKPDNPLHSKPIQAIYNGGFFFCDGTDPEEGPDYYVRDVLRFNEGFDLVGEPQ